MRDESLEVKVKSLQNEIGGCQETISRSKKYVKGGLYCMALGAVTIAASYPFAVSDSSNQSNLASRILFCASALVAFAGFSIYTLASMKIRHKEEEIELNKKHMRSINGDNYQLN